MAKRRFQYKTGFTLVESLVTITVFLVVVTSVSSIYISFVRQERKLYTYLKTENNIRFALDYMGRDIRMAHSFNFGNNFLETTTITFNDYTSTDLIPHPVTYSLDNGQIKVLRYDSGSVPVSLLDPSVKVTSFKFYITNGTKGVYQPTIIIILGATDSYGNTYSLETAVTPRNLNLLGS